MKCINWIAGTGKYDGMLGALTCVSKDMDDWYEENAGEF